MEEKEYSYDLFYNANQYPWHYDRPGRRFEVRIGEQWNLIAENQTNSKLNLFTAHYIPLKIKTLKGVKPERIKLLWDEYELFIASIKNMMSDWYKDEPDHINIYQQLFK